MEARVIEAPDRVRVVCTKKEMMMLAKLITAFINFLHIFNHAEKRRMEEDLKSIKMKLKDMERRKK